ncbi:GFA domain-containing protein [Mycena venus]|uniref:GFA domain-containing protein n=1 Tax=Mycena venus TaxID=2733690 RepID=A0A8H6YSA7_9AGAR|nr:GFA domain-containing protein [Mycena venus]
MAPPAETNSLPVPWPEGAETKVHTGGCHCKKIRYEFEHPGIYEMPVVNCNCSICEDRGYLSVSTPEDKFRFTAGSEDDMTKYEFGSRKIVHRFCSTCGTSIGPSVSIKGFVVINTRTIDGVDLDRLQLRKVDGRSRYF